MNKLSGFNQSFERIMQKKNAQKYEQQKMREDIERLRGLLHEPEIDIRPRSTTTNVRLHKKRHLGLVKRKTGG